MENISKKIIVAGINRWLENERNLKELFGNSVVSERYFQKSKLDFFKDLYKDGKLNAGKDERLMLRVIKGEIKKLEKSLYPSATVRVIIKVAGFIKDKIKDQLQKREVAINVDRLSGNRSVLSEYKTKEKQQTNAQLNDLKAEYLKDKSQDKKQANAVKVSVQKKQNQQESLLPKKRETNHKSHKL